jgi:hypothetical protein
MRSYDVMLVMALSAMAGAAACGGPEDPRPATWRFIAPTIIQPNCATSTCHSAASAVAGLDLSTAEKAWESLNKLEVMRETEKGPTPVPRRLVTPGNPEQSRVLNMLRASGARRMPPDRPLSQADIVLIETWILNGAVND